jgi:hypothetical protein
VTWHRISDDAWEWRGQVRFRIVRLNGWYHWYRQDATGRRIAQGVAPTSEMACAEAAGTWAGSVERRKR